MTTFPNFFRHKTQEEAALDAHQFWPLVQVNCSPDLAFFLCSLYTPLCSTLDSPPLPCRDLCLRVKEGCLPLMLKFGFSWPESMACEQFPVGGVDTICLDTPNTLTSKPQLPTASKTRGICLSLSVCRLSPRRVCKFRPVGRRSATSESAAPNRLQRSTCFGTTAQTRI